MHADVVLLHVIRWMSDDIIEMLTQSMIAPRPNTYTYTKAIAETLLVELCAASNVPCAIVRPSIVGASWQQPVAVSCHFCNLEFNSVIATITHHSALTFVFLC